jgi:glycosyltransferase involved in cell wall biosynthesis
VSVPSFDVVVPTFDRRELLLQTLESTLAQTLPGVRVSVVDNASQDGTPEAVAARFGDRIEYHRFDEHVPWQLNMTRALSLFRAEHGLVLHDDDLLDPSYAARMKEAFAKRPDAGMVVAVARPLQSSGSPFPHARVRAPFRWFRHLGYPVVDGRIELEGGVFAERLARNLRVQPYWPTVALSRAGLATLGAFASDLRMAADYEAWMRVSARHPTVLLDDVVCSYRFHGSMMTRRLIFPNTQALEEDILTMAGRLDAILGKPPAEDLRARFISRVLYPVVLLGPRDRRAHYERYLADSGYPFARLMEEQEHEHDEFWRAKGWPGPMARAGWQAQRALVTLQRWRRGDAR